MLDAVLAMKEKNIATNAMFVKQDKNIGLVHTIRLESWSVQNSWKNPLWTSIILITLNCLWKPWNSFYSMPKLTHTACRTACWTALDPPKNTVMREIFKEEWCRISTRAESICGYLWFYLLLTASNNCNWSQINQKVSVPSATIYSHLLKCR